MKLFMFFLSMVIGVNFLFAQDIILKQDGAEIKSKISEITSEVIKYEKFENQDGPIRNIAISEVFMVIYENGEREKFSCNENNIKVESTPVSIQTNSEQNKEINSGSMLSSAQTKEDIFNPDVPIVFFGADFSKIQFTKAEMFNNKPEILRFFVDCNNLLESKGYQKLLTKRLKRNEIKTNFSYVTNNNGSVEWQKVYSDNIDYSLSDKDIEKMIIKLNLDQQLYKDHIGMVFCEENYSKTKKLGTVAIVFFGVNDLKPILINHFSQKPGGYGFLNYWGIINLLAINNLKKLYKELK